MNRLNPNAEPFVPATTQATQQRAEYAQQHARAVHGSDSEARSLFMTFSNGSPLTWREIHEYFTR